MKQSYLESLVNLVARIILARSLNTDKHSNDNKLTSPGLSTGPQADIISFSKINPHDTPVGINFADISASNYPVLNNSVQRNISFIPKSLTEQ